MAAAAGALLAATVTVFPPGRAKSAALDPDSCGKLQAELEAMEKAGLKDILAKGAEWGKANLSPAKLLEVRRYIEVDEQLLFRCPGRHLVNLPLDPDPPPPAPDDKKNGKEAAPADGKADSPAAAAKPDNKKPAIEKKPAAPSREKQKSAAAESDDAPETAKPQAKPKPKPRPKPKDDAYKPPASDPDNPFGLAK